MQCLNEGRRCDRGNFNGRPEYHITRETSTRKGERREELYTEEPYR